MSSVQNYITEDTTITGNITTASSLTIAGVVEGDINAGGEVLVLDDANVKGDLSGRDVRISGKVQGRISATGKLTISPSGEVHGDITVRALLIEDGGTLQGQCRMGTDSSAMPSAPTRVRNVNRVPPPGQTMPLTTASSGPSSGTGPVATTSAAVAPNAMAAAGSGSGKA